MPAAASVPGHKGEAGWGEICAGGRRGRIGREDFDTAATGGAIDAVGKGGYRGSRGEDAGELFCSDIGVKVNLMYFMVLEKE